MVELPYRPCVGMVVLNEYGQIFFGKRIDNSSKYWQMPQGGVDEGEGLEQAALRELEEEIGTNNVQVLGQTKDWLYYDLPDELVAKVWNGKYRGQKQIWFCVQLLGDDGEININTENPEFEDWKWSNPDQVIENAIEFKKDIYRKVLDYFNIQ